MPFDVNSALKEGYSQTEIVDFLAKEKKFDVDSARKEGYTDNELIQYLNPAPKKQGLLTNLQRGAESAYGDIRTGFSGVLSPTEAAKTGIERDEEMRQRLGPQESRLSKVEKAYADKGLLSAIGTGLGEIPGAIAEQVPQLGVAFGGARLGAMAGAPLGPYGAAAGAVGGAFLPFFFQQYGGNIKQQAEVQKEKGEKVDVSGLKGAGFAVPMAGLDVAAAFIPFGRQIAGKMFGPSVEKLLNKGLTKEAGEEAAKKLSQESFLPSIKNMDLGTVVKGTGKTALMEMPTEITQQVLGRMQSGQDLFSPEAMREYGETAFDVALLGPLGIYGRSVDKSAARQQILEAQKKAAETKEPQELLLLTHDPKVQGNTINVPIIVHPDGSTSFPSEANQFRENPVSEFTDQGLKEAYAPQQGAIALEKQAEANRIVTPETIKGLGIGSSASIFKSGVINQSLSNPDVADSVRKQLLDIKFKNKNEETKAKIDAFLQRPEFNTPKVKEESLVPEGEGKFISIFAPGPNGYQSYKGKVSDDEKTVTYTDDSGKVQKVNSKSKNVVVAPTEADLKQKEIEHLEDTLKSIEEERDAAGGSDSKFTKDFKAWLRKNPLSMRQATEVGVIQRYKDGRPLPIREYAHKGYLSPQGLGSDELALAAYRAGFLTDQEYANSQDTEGENAFMEMVRGVLEPRGKLQAKTSIEDEARFRQADDAINHLQDEIAARKGELESIPNEEQLAKQYRMLEDEQYEAQMQQLENEFLNALPTMTPDLRADFDRREKKLNSKVENKDNLRELSTEKKSAPPKLAHPAGLVLKKGRNEQVVLAARALAAKKITKEEFDAYVDYYMPINTVLGDKLESPIEDNLMRDILLNKIKQKKKPELINASISDGTKVGLRMDIPALDWGRENGVNGSVVSIHKGSNPENKTQGENIGYKSAGAIKNVVFATRSQETAFKIAQQLEPEIKKNQKTGKEYIKDVASKSPQQTIEGSWVNMSPSEIMRQVKENLNNPAWKQISLDPLRHSYFYDRDSRQPVISADEVLQVGRFVLAKNVKFDSKENYLYEKAYEPTEKFQQNAKELGKRLRKSLDKMGLKNIGINFEKNLQAMVDGKLTDVNGTYLNSIITLSLDNPNITRTFNHEALHALKAMGMFSDAEWAVLENRAEKEWIKEFKIKERYPEVDHDTQIEEAIAAAFPEYMKWGDYEKTLGQRIKDFFDRVRNVFRGLGFMTSDMVYNRSAKAVFQKAKEGRLTGANIIQEGRGPLAEKIKQQTEKFKKWFGNSKVVDENGEPLVVYHGTRADIKEFNPFAKAVTQGGEKVKRTGAMFFSESPELASQYTGTAKSPMFDASPKTGGYYAYPQNSNEGGNIMPVYLKIENPYVIDANGQMYHQVEDQIKKAKKLGHDGVIFKNVVDASGAGGSLQATLHNAYIAFEPNQIKSAIGNNGEYNIDNPDIRYEMSLEGVNKDTADKINSIFGPTKKLTVKEKFKDLQPNFYNRLITGLFDEFRPIKNYGDEAYMKAVLSKTTDGALEGLLMHGHVTLKDGALDIKQGTKGLLEILKPLGADVERYQVWKALSRDANLPENMRSFKDLSAQKGELLNGDINGVPRKDIYQKVLNEENKLNKSVLDIAKAQGIIDDEAYQKFSTDMYYIPFYKAMENGDLVSVQDSSKLTGQYFSKALKGGEKEKMGDLMENTLRNWSHILSASMKNAAAVSTLDSASKLGAATPVKSTYEGKGVLTVMKDGKKAYYAVTDPDLVESISMISFLGPKSPFLDVAKGFTNALRFGVTLSPGYKLRNLIRDTISSAAISPVGMNVLDNVQRGLKLSNKGNPTYVSAMAGGGVFELGAAHEGNQAALVKRLIAKGVKPDTILSNSGQIKSILKDMYERYNEFGNKFENANRLALYDKMIKEGKSHLEASYAARDLLNFTGQGSWRAVKTISQVVPFFNTRLQGLYKLGRDGISPTSRVLCNMATGKPIEESDKLKAQRFSIVSSAVALASVGLYMAYEDDEDFKKREDWDRDNFWWFKVDDVAYRIPKPFEIGALGTIAERSVEQIRDENVEGKVFYDRLRAVMMDTLSLNPTPQFVKPMIDLYANKDSFTGAPIESTGMERLSKQERVTNNTSELAKALGGISEGAAKILTLNPEAQGFSPVQMDYALKAYLGWLGSTVATVSDKAVQPWSEVEKPGKPALDQYSMGFVKSLPETQSKYVTNFYNNSKRINEAFADMKRFAEHGEMDKVANIMAEKGDLIALQKVYEQTTNQMAEYRKYINFITNDKTMSKEDKEDQITRMKVLISQLAENAEGMRKSLKK